jgi:hypothetical protein
LYCRSWDGYFLETHGTLFHGKRLSVELIVRVLACLAAGLGLRATARVFEVAPNTVLQGLGEAAEQLRTFPIYFLGDVPAQQLQLDALYAVIRALKAGERSEEDASERLEGTRPWLWTAIDPVSTLLLAHEVGPRTVALAQRVGHQVVGILAPGWVGARVGSATGLRGISRPSWATLACRRNPSAARTRDPVPNRAGCPCPRCFMRRSLSSSGASA